MQPVLAQAQPVLPVHALSPHAQPLQVQPLLPQVQPVSPVHALSPHAQPAVLAAVLLQQSEPVAFALVLLQQSESVVFASVGAAAAQHLQSLDAATVVDVSAFVNKPTITSRALIMETFSCQSR